MKVRVDLDRCEGHGLCVFAAPEVFDLDDDGLLHYDPDPPEALRTAVEEAVRACPVAAIRLEPDAPVGTRPSDEPSSRPAPTMAPVTEVPSARPR